VAQRVTMLRSAVNRASCVALAMAGLAWAATPPVCRTTDGDFNGHDILPSNPPAVTDGQACCTKCAAHPGCVAFSYALDSGTCYLKSAAPATAGGNSDRLSGWVNSSCSCNATDPTPPKCWSTPHPCGHPTPPAPPPPVPGAPALGSYRCLPETPSAAMPFCDKSKSVADRVAWIVQNVSADEMVRVVLKQGVDRLDIPGYNMWAVEALHGVRLWPEKCPFADKCTTIFPAASTGSRAFNKSLWQMTGRAMGTEGRVLWNLGVISDLSLRGPQVNIQRDPRWGRNSNSPSEDPLLTGLYGEQLVLGTQSPLNGVNLINSQMKHWTAYGVEANRFGFNGNISVHDLAETYMEPLHRMLDANVSAAMCAYDAINGTPSCANGWMSDRVLRQHWGWQGVIESDCGAIKNIWSQHHYTSDGPSTAAAGMNGTCDVECDSIYSQYLDQAYKSGLVSLEQLSAATRRILTHRFTLGLFDDPRQHPYFTGIYNDSATVHNAAHAQIAREGAEQGIVLVQNPAKLLPLKAAGVKYAVVGPIGNITDPFLGDYRPAACPGTTAKAPASTSCLPTLLELITARVSPPNVAFAAGCDDPTCGSANADVILLMLGEKATDDDSGGNTAGEGHDRATIGLPGQQPALVRAALATGKPVVAVIVSGGSVSVDALKAAPNAAVLYPGFGGETGQNAIVDVLFGDVVPSGRLPFTVYPETWGDATSMNDMSFQGGQGRSYKYLLPTVEPLYEFGAGLSYTTFTVTPTTSGTVALTAAATEVCATISNSGGVDSSVVVTLFAVPKTLRTPPRLVPNRKLVDFDKLNVAMGGTTKVCFNVTDADLALVDDNGATAAYTGAYDLLFFDGVNKATVAASVAADRVIATVPPVDNPTPPCCNGTVHTCC